MHFFDHAAHRDYEEGLRTLGGMLDEQGLEDALVLELAEGFLATGRRRRSATDDGTVSMYEHAETVVRDDQVDATSQQAQAQRGTGRVAGRYEQELRLIGQRVNADHGSLVLLVDQGDGFVLRMLSSGASTASTFSSTSIGTAELDLMRSRSIEARAG